MIHTSNRVLGDVVIALVQHTINSGDNDVRKLAHLMMTVKRCAPYMFVDHLCELKEIVNRSIADQRVKNTALWEIVVKHVDHYINYDRDCSNCYYY